MQTAKKIGILLAILTLFGCGKDVTARLYPGES